MRQGVPVSEAHDAQCRKEQAKPEDSYVPLRRRGAVSGKPFPEEVEGDPGQGKENDGEACQPQYTDKATPQADPFSDALRHRAADGGKNRAQEDTPKKTADNRQTQKIPPEHPDKLPRPVRSVADEAINPERIEQASRRPYRGGLLLVVHNEQGARRNGADDELGREKQDCPGRRIGEKGEYAGREEQTDIRQGKPYPEEYVHSKRHLCGLVSRFFGSLFIILLFMG